MMANLPGFILFSRQLGHQRCSAIASFAGAALRGSRCYDVLILAR